jgi:hypothetical protein
MAYLDQIMELLQADATITGACDLLLAECPRDDIELTGPNQMILALFTQAVTKEDRWKSQYRDVEKSDLKIVIEVLSGKGDNDYFCNVLVEYITNKMSTITTFLDVNATWVLHIDSYVSDVTPDDRPGRWKGTTTLTGALFENV